MFENPLIQMSMEHSWVKEPCAPTTKTGVHSKVDRNHPQSISDIIQRLNHIWERSKQRKNASAKLDAILSDMLRTSIEEFELLNSSSEGLHLEEIADLALELAKIISQEYEPMLVDEFDIFKTEIKPHLLPQIAEYDAIPLPEDYQIQGQSWSKWFSFDYFGPRDYSSTYIRKVLPRYGVGSKDHKEEVYKEEKHPTSSEVTQIRPMVQLMNITSGKRTSRVERRKSPRHYKLVTDQIATTKHPQASPVTSDEVEADNLLGRKSLQAWKEHAGKNKSWKRVPTQKYKGKQRHTPSFNALPSVLEKQSCGLSKTSIETKKKKIKPSQERTRGSKRAPGLVVRDVLQEWNFPSRNMPFIRLESGMYTDTHLKLIHKKERRAHPCSKPLPTFVRPSASMVPSQSKPEPPKPKGYKWFTKSGKRKIRKKLQINKHKEKEGFQRRAETKSEKTTVPKRIVQWRNRKLKRGTDSFQHCYGVWRGFSCGHNYRVLCPSCDDDWNKGISQKCLLLQCLEASSGLFVDVISECDIFFPHPCVICPWYDYPALPRDSVSVRVVSEKLPVRIGAQKSPGPTFWSDQFKRKDVICRFCMKRNHPIALSLFSDYWMNWADGGISNRYGPVDPDSAPLLDIITTCKDIRALPRSEIRGADEDRPLICPECGTTWFALRTHDSNPDGQYILATQSASREAVTVPKM